MARPKVIAKIYQPKHIRAQEFKDEEKRAELYRQRKYTNEIKAKKRINIDPNMPPRAQEFVNSIHAFTETH